MKVTEVRTEVYEFELERPVGDANFPDGMRRWAGMGVFVDTDEDLTGVSISFPETRSHIHSIVDGVIVGHDPRGVRGLWQDMMDVVFKGGNSGIVAGAVCAIDVALWDLKAKLNGEPLWKTLGASTRRVRAYASGIDMPLSDDELRRYYEAAAAQGICAGKLKVGLDREADMRRIGVMRDALAGSGKKPVLTVDANEYWSPKQAIRHLSAYEEEYDLFWVEEPARRWDYNGLRQISQAVKTAVATGENLSDISQFALLLREDAVDIVQANHGCSGITGNLMVAELAYAFDRPFAMGNSPGHFMAHVAAALPNHVMLELFGVDYAPYVTSDTRIEDGWIVLGDRPGLGIEFDPERLEAFKARDGAAHSTHALPARRRGAGLYEVGPEEPARLDEE